jgi:Arc/MetJ-type ribon-helix-helix transcriptional regulator
MTEGDCVTITIRPEHEHLIVEAIESGSYQSPDELIARALEVLRSEDEWLDENKTAVGEKIERAFGQFERGEFFSPAQSRAEMEKRKAEWLREHRA